MRKKPKTITEYEETEIMKAKNEYPDMGAEP